MKNFFFVLTGACFVSIIFHCIMGNFFGAFAAILGTIVACYGAAILNN